MASGVGRAARQRAALAAGGAGVGGQLGGDGGLVGGAEGGEPGEDAPAQLGVEFGTAVDGAVGQPALEGVGLGGGVDEVAYGDEAQPRVGAVLGAADQVAAEAGEGGERGGAGLGGDVAGGDLAVGEGEDALDEGEVALVREVGAGGGEIARWVQLAVTDRVAGGVPDDGPGQGVGDGGELAEGGLPGGGVQADLGVGEVAVVEDDEGGAAAGPDGGGRAVVRRARHVDLEAVAGARWPGPAWVLRAWSKVATAMRWGRLPSRSTVRAQDWPPRRVRWVR